MAFFLGPLIARGAMMVLRPAISSVARGAAEAAGSMAVSFVGQSAVDHLSTLGSTPAGQIASTAGSILVENQLNMMTGGGPMGALMNLPGQIDRVSHLAQNLTDGTVRPGGTGGQVLGAGGATGVVANAGAAAPPPTLPALARLGATNPSTNPPYTPGSVGAPSTNPPNTTNPYQSAQSVYNPELFTGTTNSDGTVSTLQSSRTFTPGPGTVSNPANMAMTHAEVIDDVIARNRAANLAAAAMPHTGSVSSTPLPVSTAHDAMPVLQAQTPMDATGPAATQGNPQPIPLVAAGLHAFEVEPTRVYNQDHSAQLPPATVMPTMQHQVVVTSDPPPPGRHHQQGSGSGVLLAVGAVTVGGVIIFLWYRQKRA